MKAMIFAAGLGTRLHPLTKTTPKALVQVAGKTLLEHTILTLKQAGVNLIIINVHHFADQIIDFIKENDNFGIEIIISDERDKLLNTGGGIKNIKKLLNDNCPLIIHNVDVFSNANLKKLYDDHKADNGRLASLIVSERDTARYLLFDKNNELKGWVNLETNELKPHYNLIADEYQKLAFAGIQIISSDIFNAMESFGDVFSIIDFYLHVSHNKRIVACQQDDFKMMDVGKIDIIKEAEKFIQELN